MPHQMTLKQLSQALAAKTVSSVELTQHFLNRIQTYDKQLNAFISTNPEQALAAAANADKLIASGKATALTGIPIAHKDIFCTEGIKTSCASLMLDNYIAPYDATVVHKLAQAGTISLGKLNMDAFAMGSSNEYSYYGNVHNPWDLDATPGGSSGGSSAAVAARIIPAATGTDTGGSIRQPAAFCGITGIKPTYGRISRHGQIAFASSLDQAGPITQTAEDAAMLLQAMAGHDPKDSTCSNEPVPNYMDTLNHSLEGRTIGLPNEYFDDNLAPDLAKAITDTISVFEKMGCKIKTISLPHTQYAVAAYYVIAPAECSANLARYDGVRYGHRCKNPANLEDLYIRSRTEGFRTEVKRRILLGTYVLSSGYYDAYYLKALQVRRKVRDDFIQAFSEVDFILTPTTLTCAYNLGEKRDPATTYAADVYTVPTNLAGLPGLSMPVGFSQGGRPFGAQLIAPHFAEGLLLNAAHQYQQQTDWHQQMPSLTT